MRLAALRAPAGVRHASGLPFRIRAPAAKLLERKSRGQAPGEKTAAGGLGDGEKLETGDDGADYVRLGLTSRVYDMIQESPLQYAAGLSSRLNANLHIKREDLLPSFSYKIRGAYNRIRRLTEAERKAGVVAASAGNHAQGVALAASRLGVEARIVMPRTTPRIKVDAVRRLGAEAILEGDSYDDAAALARRLREEEGRIFVHPYDDLDVIAGQGTVAM